MKRLIVIVSSIALLLNWTLPIRASTSTENRQELAAAKVLPAIVQVGVAAGSPAIWTVGTGVIIKDNGYILTAKHNVSGSMHVFVKLTDGTEYPVVYYIADAHRDLALLRIIPTAPLPVVEVEDSDTLKPGQAILVFGFPASSLIHGNHNTATVSQGIVSALERELEESAGMTEAEKSRDSLVQWGTHRGASLFPGLGQLRIKHLIQLDAMMNPGSSGGAVTTLDGKLVGICHSMVSNTGGNVGLNFAIAINEAEILLTLAGMEGGKTDEQQSAR